MFLNIAELVLIEIFVSWPQVFPLPDLGPYITDGSPVVWASGRVRAQCLLPIPCNAPWWAICCSSLSSAPFFYFLCSSITLPTSRGTTCRETTAGSPWVDSYQPEEVMWAERSGAELSLWREADTWSGLSCGLSVTIPPYSIPAFWWPWRIERNHHGQIRSRHTIHRSALLLFRILSALSRRCNFSVWFQFLCSCREPQKSCCCHWSSSVVHQHVARLAIRHTALASCQACTSSSSGSFDFVFPVLYLFLEASLHASLFLIFFFLFVCLFFSKGQLKEDCPGPAKGVSSKAEDSKDRDSGLGVR